METLRRLLNIVLRAIVLTIALPLWLIDYVFIDYWVERRAKKWRSHPEIGDKVIFNRGSGRVYTVVALQRSDAKKRKARVEYKGWGVRTSSWHDLSRLYPSDRSH